MSAGVRIQAVLVLYRCSLQDSKTWQLLKEQVDNLDPSIWFRLLVCDNGPASIDPAVFPEWVDYALAAKNRGLAWAYQKGLKRAQQERAEWLLTLDQDTSLPPDFLSRMLDLAARLIEVPAAGAIVPQLVSADGRVHSPVIAKLGREVTTSRGFSGWGEGNVRPYNSAALVRVSALAASGAYDCRFWLDYLDHATFFSLTGCGYKIWIAGELQVHHNLSLHDDRFSMSGQRFESFLRAESAFRDLHGSWLEGLLLTARLGMRLLNQWRRGDPPDFFRSTVSMLRDRIFLSRAQRIAQWEVAVAPMQQIDMVESGSRMQSNPVRRESLESPEPGSTCGRA